jgi:hypothetical protein
MGSSVYRIFSLIDSPSPPPITCPEDANHFVAVGEPYRQDAITDSAEAVVPPFSGAMRKVLGDDPLGIGKRELRH